MRDWKTAALAIFLMMGVTACEVDDYPSGDGRYSYMRADFGMLHTTDDAKADYMLTDEGDSIAFSSPSTVPWKTVADTLWRALVYHDVASKTMFSATPVGVVTPTTAPQSEPIPTDPLTINSVWVGGGYLNIGFAVKTGQTDSIGARQEMGLVVENVTTGIGGGNVFNLRVAHAQNGMPEYYTVSGYMSMPLTSDMRGASIRLRANTYEGERVFLVN